MDMFSSSSDQTDKKQEIRQLQERQADVQQTLKTKKQYFEQLSINIEKMISDRNSLMQEKQEHTSKIGMYFKREVMRD